MSIIYFKDIILKEKQNKITIDNMTTEFLNKTHALLSTLKEKMKEKNKEILFVAYQVQHCLTQLIQLCNNSMADRDVEKQLRDEYDFMTDILRERVDSYIDLVYVMIRAKLVELNMNESVSVL